MEKLNTIQKREKLNDVYRHGEPGPGGAYHDYTIVSVDGQHILEHIEFQKGPRKDPGSRHGVLDVDLLEIVRDRLSAFCKGSMPSWETEMALQNVEAALKYLNKRTEDRIERGILGTMENPAPVEESRVDWALWTMEK